MATTGMAMTGMADDAALIAALAAAEHRPTAALREALRRPGPVAEAALPLLEAAAAGEDLGPEGENLLFWGLHVMAQTRDTRALPPLLALLQRDGEDVEAALGDALTMTLSRVLASLFDGDPAPLFRLILDSTVDDYARMALLSACTFLVLEGRIGREAMRDLLARFDDAEAAVEGAPAWSGWEEAIARLGLRELAPRVEAAQADGRIDPTVSGPDWFADTLRRAVARPGDRADLDPYQHGYLDDAVEALAWTVEGAGMPRKNPFKDVGRNDPCPCGSGRKFKKCCLGKPVTEEPWVPPGPLSG